MGRQLNAAVLSPFVRHRSVTVLNNEHYSRLERLAELAAVGGHAPCVERSCPLAQVPEAIRRLTPGKLAAK